MTDYTARRRMMVDTQVRPSDVTKFPIIEAMLSVPRERFVPAALREAAYAEELLEIAPGRILLEPRTTAKMLEAVNIRPGELVLDIGCGLGYSAALAARLADAVVALEDDPELAAEAQTTLSEEGIDNVAVIEGPLTGGAAQHGPYDVILVEGGVEAVPDALSAQLKEGGRIGAIFIEGPLGIARVGHMADGAVSWRFAFNASAPLLGGFAREREFVF